MKAFAPSMFLEPTGIAHPLMPIKEKGLPPGAEMGSESANAPASIAADTEAAFLSKVCFPSKDLSGLRYTY